jgi:hypothetical protein
MALRLGYYRNDALKRMFRLAGQGGYTGTTGMVRKRVNALLWNYWHKPSPAA